MKIVVFSLAGRKMISPQERLDNHVGRASVARNSATAIKARLSGRQSGLRLRGGGGGKGAKSISF